jgi:transposase
VPDTPLVPPDDVAWLRGRIAELEAANAWLREAAVARAELADAQLAARDAQLAVLTARLENLERRLGKDSSTSSKPPSSDSPYKKKPRDRSLRGKSGRKPGKQPGTPSSALKQSADPDEIVQCVPAACCCCGADLAGAPVTGVHRRQVFEAAPPPPPDVIEYQVQDRECARCGTVSTALAPAGVTSLVQYGPGARANAALAVCGHYLPVARAAEMVAALTGVAVSAGFMAGVRGKAAARCGPFMDRVRLLLREAGVLYADETPARTAGKLH